MDLSLEKSALVTNTIYEASFGEGHMRPPLSDAFLSYTENLRHRIFLNYQMNCLETPDLSGNSRNRLDCTSVHFYTLSRRTVNKFIRGQDL